MSGNIIDWLVDWLIDFSLNFNKFHKHKKYRGCFYDYNPDQVIDKLGQQKWDKKWLEYPNLISCLKSNLSVKMMF